MFADTMNDSQEDASTIIQAAQSVSIEPEHFQSSIIENMARTLLHETAPPCLLRAPTGAGKTFMLARVLADVSANCEVLWLWFVPYVNLVAQTLDSIVSNTADLTPMLLDQGRNQEIRAGQVLISTVQAVARAQSRTKGYDADGDDDTRTMAQLIGRARSQQLRIGLVVDEAHIALDRATEFGRFAQWLAPDFLIMATATPKDQRLLDFLGSAGRSNFESFSVSRDVVVDARLNKRFIEAIIYSMHDTIQTVADLKRTVLRQAWKRHQRLKKQLQDADVKTTPLLLVQVANGAKTVEEAEHDLIQLCKVHPSVIGKHSSDEPDPVMMAAIANDSTKEVLIFKQSAGTGFDAPRAFILASTKAVNDPDFAMQFIGRVMRVSQGIRARFSRTETIPPELDTAFVYLANPDAQQGFEAAVAASGGVKNQLEGQTEKLEVRQTRSGAVVLTNRVTPQKPLKYDLGLPRGALDPTDKATPRSTAAQSNSGESDQRSLFGSTNEEDFDEDATKPAPSTSREKVKPQTEAELFEAFSEHGIRAYKRAPASRMVVDKNIKREKRPELLDMSAISRSVAAKLDISAKLSKDAVNVALNKVKQTEIHTELTTKAAREEYVQIVTDRNALAKEALAKLRTLPQVEDEDCRIIVEVLCKRLLPAVREAFEDLDEVEQPDDKTLVRHAIDAAHWIVLKEVHLLAEGMHEAIAEQAEVEDAADLPDAMLFPEDLPLIASRKNLFGVMPPTMDEVTSIPHILVASERSLLVDRMWQVGGISLSVGKYDGSLVLNEEERAFARALDRAEFVRWWHRNPDKKPYATRLVRGEHKHFFYPDFVVWLEHYPGDDIIARLVETKESVKDAARKAKHVFAYYGAVLFLTKDTKRLRWVNEDGSLGSDVDVEDLSAVREWMRRTRPTIQ